MANSLGSIFVELLVNTGQFISGFGEAGLASRKFRNEFESAFSGLSGLVGTALAPLGAFGSTVSATLANVGIYGATAAKSLSGLGGSMGALASVGGLAAGAVGAVSLGSLALAAHTAESIAKLGELSQSTGVSVSALSGLGFAGKAVGIEIDTMAKGLEKMDKAVFKAATSTEGSVNAFTRLHIAVRDASGGIRSTEAIFGDLAEKFAAMPDGVTKTALAIEVFGRGGAVMVPLLNRGKQGIQEFLDTAKALGIVLDDQTVKAAETFKESMASIEAAGSGIALRLTKDLLPALNTLAEKLVDSFKTGGAQNLIDKLAALVKTTVVVGDAFFHTFELIGVFIEGIGGEVLAFFNAIGAGLEAMAHASVGDFSGARAALKAGYDGLKQEGANFLDSSKKAFSDFQGFRDKIFAGPQYGPFPVAPKTGGAGADTAKEKDSIFDRIKARIDALGIEAKKWDDVARAGSAAGRLIAEAQKAGTDELGKLLADAAKDKTGTATGLVNQNETFIRFQAAKKVYSAAIDSLNKDLDKQTNTFKQDEAASLGMAAAYETGGSAIAKAALDKQFAADAAKAGVLFDALGVLTPRLQQAKDAKAAFLAAGLQEQLNQETHSLSVMAPFVDALSAAYLTSADAVRKARIELELQKAIEDARAKGVEFTPRQIEQKRAGLTAADREAYEGMLRQEAAQFDLNALYDQSITKLERVREVIQQSGTSTLLIDAQIFDAEERLIHQWDDAAFKVGSFGQKLKGVFNELAIAGKNAGDAITHAWLTAIDGVETQFAKFLTGQKTNFKDVFLQLSESIVKAQIQKGVGAIAQHFGLDLGKPDGTSHNPFHVVMAGAGGLVGAATGGGEGGGGGIFGFFKGLLGFGGGGGTPGFSMPEGWEGDLFPGGFGGAGAEGLDMMPGKWYVAGEKGTELIGPKNQGNSIYPLSKMGGKSIVNNNTFNFPTDTDLFRRSGPQIAQMLHRQTSIAMARG